VISGLALIDKPAGITSHDAIARLRRTLNTKKVGHAGTLDPMATGLLLVGVGSATRLLHYLVGADKAYSATIALGFATTTDDAEGEPIGERADEAALAVLNSNTIEAELEKLRGAISQLPTRVSAIKVGGRRAHELVRSGADFELKPRQVTISRFERTSELRTSEHGVEFDAEIECSSGTYVRALARDLGAALGVGGHLSALRRTRVGQFSIGDATDPEAPKLIDPASVAKQIFEALVIDQSTELALVQGRQPESSGNPGRFACINSSRELVAIANRENNRLRSEVVFVRSNA
jgi:tRNA pseudouridine55 synthase